MLLHNIMRKAQRLALPVWLSWVATLPVFVALCVVGEDGSSWAALGIVAGVVWLAFSPLMLRDARRAATESQRDLDLGKVEIFEWQVPADFGDAPRHALEVLRASGRIIGGGTRPTRRLARVIVSEVAASRSDVGAPVFPRQITLNAAGDSVERIRSLSGGELDELKSFCGKLGRFPYLWAAVGLCWVIMTLTSALAHTRDRSDWSLTLLLGALIAVTWNRRIKLLRLKARLDKDIQAAIVEEKSPDRYPHPAGAKLPAIVEVLPNSNAVWTVDGEPAGWRKTV